MYLTPLSTICQIYCAWLCALLVEKPRENHLPVESHRHTNIEHIPDACQNVLILNTSPGQNVLILNTYLMSKCTNIEHVIDVKMY